MVCDDDLTDLAGKELVSVEVNDARSSAMEEELPNSYDAHEVSFLEIKANDIVVGFHFHNEHNGYYGGFHIQINEVGQA